MEYHRSVIARVLAEVSPVSFMKNAQRLVVSDKSIFHYCNKNGKLQPQLRDERNRGHSDYPSLHVVMENPVRLLLD